MNFEDKELLKDFLQVLLAGFLFIFTFFPTIFLILNINFIIDVIPHSYFLFFSLIVGIAGLLLVSYQLLHDTFEAIARLITNE